MDPEFLKRALKTLCLDAVGNVKVAEGDLPDYRIMPHMLFYEESRGNAESQSPVKLSLILKLYGIHKPKHCRLEQLADIKLLLKREIVAGTIQKRAGMGFAMFSPYALNVGVWNKNSPILYTNLFEWDERILEAEEREEGGLSIPEAFIANFEAKKWGKYLLSKRKLPDKIAYLTATYGRDHTCPCPRTT